MINQKRKSYGAHLDLYDLKLVFVKNGAMLLRFWNLFFYFYLFSPFSFLALRLLFFFYYFVFNYSTTKQSILRHINL
jgi:hypothetical protein